MITQDSLVLPRRRWRWRESRRGRWRKGSGTAGLLGGREAATGGGGIPRRGDRKPPAVTAASPRASGTPVPSRRAMFFNSRTVIQSPSMITPVQTPITPAMISVLPVLNSLTAIPYADRQQARQNKADPGDQHNKHHRTNPSAAPETLASRPTPRYRHIVRTANRQLHPGFRNSVARLQDCGRGQSCCHSGTVQPATRSLTAYQLLPFCCIASGI